MFNVETIIDQVLDTHPDGATLTQITAAVKQRGGRVPRSVIEKTLNEHPRFVAEVVLGRQYWTVNVDVSIDDDELSIPTSVSAGSPLDGLSLRDWQVHGFAAWAQTGCVGVVEAVTGAGKTRLALAAVRACLAQGGRVLVLVPTLELVAQWRRQLGEHVPGAIVGQLGDGHDDDLWQNHVVIATPHSAALVPLDFPNDVPGLLVADEAHRYGAPTWAAALKPHFGMRLALTATYERNDEGIVEVLAPYFGTVVTQYGYAEAAQDGIIAPFKITFMGVALTSRERATYDAADRKTREHRAELVAHGLPREPMALIQAAAALTADAEAIPPQRAPREVQAARAYLSALRQRRDVAAQAEAKLAVIDELAPSWKRDGVRGLVFTDTVDQAEEAVSILRRHTIPADPLHGELPRKKRRIRMAQFRNGNLSMLAAPRVLDEGLDVPDADLAVVLAAFRTRRQMIQRLGRILRLKPDGRSAHLIIVFAEDTREDPKRGAQHDFLNEVVDVAQSVTTVRSGTAVQR